MVDNIKHIENQGINKAFKKAKDFFRPQGDRLPNNDHLRPEINKPLSDSAQKVLKNFFKKDVTNTQIFTDGHGNFGVKVKDHTGNFGEGFMDTIDVRGHEPEIQKDLAYHIERHIVQHHAEKYANAHNEAIISIEDLNQLKKIDGEYHFIKRDETAGILQIDEGTQKNINKDLSDLGIYETRNVKHSIEKGVLEYISKKAVEKVKDTTNKDALRESIEKGLVYDFSFDKASKKYDFYAVPKDGKKDGEMVRVSFEQKDLPPEVRINLRYQEKKIAVAKEFNLNINEIHRLHEINGEYHYIKSGINGPEKMVLKPTGDQINRIDKYLSDRGLSDDKRYISQDFIGRAVIEKEIKSKNANIDRTAINAEVERTTVYDYHYNEKEAEPHVFHAVKMEQVNGQWVDSELMKVSLTDQQFKDIFNDAELDAAQKYIKLPDGETIKPGGVEVDPNDENKYLVTATDGGKHTIPKADIAADIANELDISPRAKLDDVLTEKTGLEVHADLGGEDDTLKEQIEEKEAQRKRLEKSLWWNQTIWKGAALTNDQLLNMAQSVEGIISKMLQSAQGDGGQQQMSPATHAIADHKISKKHREHEDVKEEIKILKEQHEKSPGGYSREGKILQDIAELKNKHKQEQKKDKQNTDEGYESGEN